MKYFYPKILFSKNAVLSVFFLLLTLGVFSQNVGINNPAPDAKALLDLTSTTKGLLIPRMTTVQRTAVGFLPNATAYASGDGMLVYDTDIKTLMQWNGLTSKWDTLLTAKLGKGSYWALLGNNGTNAATNFIGTPIVQIWFFGQTIVND